MKTATNNVWMEVVFKVITNVLNFFETSIQSFFLQYLHFLLSEHSSYMCVKCALITINKESGVLVGRVSRSVGRVESVESVNKEKTLF